MAVVITGSTITAPAGAIDAADLTGDLDASLLTGTLPAIDGAALTGVGGATSLVTDWTDLSTSVKSFIINFTDDQDIYIIEIEDVTFSGSYTANYLQLRLTDSSDTVISASLSYYRGKPTESPAESSTGGALFDSLHGTADTTVDSGGVGTALVEIRNPKSSTAHTRFSSQGFLEEDNDMESPQTYFGRPASAPQVHNGVQFFNAGSGGNFASGRYRVIGVKL